MKKITKDFWSLEGTGFDSDGDVYGPEFELDEIENLTTEDIFNFIDRDDARETELDLEDLAERHYYGSFRDLENERIFDDFDLSDFEIIDLDLKRKASWRKG